MANTPIQELIKQYEHECCDFSDTAWLVKSALRMAQTMPDSQARCLLYALAKHVEAATNR